MMKNLTLNIVKSNKPNVNDRIVLSECPRDIYESLLTYTKNKDVNLREGLINQLKSIKPTLQLVDIIAIAGSEEEKPIFDNILLRRLIPSVTIQVGDEKKESYYCYAAYDFKKLHANTVIHEDSSSAASCAVSRLGNVKYVIVYREDTQEDIWDFTPAPIKYHPLHKKYKQPVENE